MMDGEQNALGFSEVADGAQEPAVGVPADDTTAAGASAAEEQGAVTLPVSEEKQDGEDVPAQSREENERMAAARRAGQREAYQMAEERLRREQDRRIAAYGVTNPNTGQPFLGLDEFLAYGETVAAQNAGVSVEQLRTQRAAQERAMIAEAQLVTVQSELWRVQAEAELKQLKGVFPEIRAQEVSELGEEFIRLRAAGVPAEAAYLAARGAAAATARPMPPSMGRLSKENPEKEFYTSEELDALTSGQLDDPGVFKRAMDSLARLGARG